MCNSCGKIHQIHGANRKPLKCEACSERFVIASSANEMVDEEAEGEIVHYEVDCPECETHYEIDLPSGLVIFDCGECGCSFSVEEESGFRKSGSQTMAAEAVEEVRSGRSEKRRPSMRKALSISKQKEKHPWLNSVISFMIATFVCFGFVVYLIVKSFDDPVLDHSPSDADALPKLVNIDAEKGDKREELFAISDLSDRQARPFLRALESFVGAMTLEDKAKLCRFPGVAGIRMQRHYMNEIYGSKSLLEQERLGPVQLVTALSGQKFLQARFRDKNGSEATYVGEIGEGGGFSFEWEPTANFSELLWGDVERGAIDQAVMALVRIEKSTRYSSELSPDKYASYEVFRKGLGDGFVAYAEIGSDAEKTLSSVFTRDQFPLLGVDDRPSTKRVMLKFDFPKEWNPDGGSRYGRIVEVVQEDWVRYEK